MLFKYMANIEDDPDGGFVVTFSDVPEAITAGETKEEALTNAREALGLALRGLLQEGNDLPQPITTQGTPVSVEADVALKLGVIQAFKSSGISKSELARRIGREEKEARRILDPDHATKIGLLQEALHVLGMEVTVSVQRAA